MSRPPKSEAALTAIDRIIARFFATFDNRVGRVPDAEGFHELFVPGAVIASHTRAGPNIATVEEFIRPRIELLASGRLRDFHEWETEAATEVLGSLAARRSRYEKKGVLAGQPYAGQGAKFFQLACSGAQWRIVALSWIDDAEH